MAKVREEFIREFTGQIIGVVEYHDNGDKAVRNFPGQQILGYYRKKYDHTTNFLGVIVAKGDAVVSLLFQNRQ